MAGSINNEPLIDRKARDGPEDEPRDTQTPNFWSPRLCRPPTKQDGTEVDAAQR